MRLVHRWVFGAGLVALVVSVLALVAPLHGPGLSGSALEPYIGAFGWYASSPLPANPTDAQFRAAGVARPWNSLEHRRREVAAVAAVAAGLLETGFVLRRLHRRRARKDSMS